MLDCAKKPRASEPTSFQYLAFMNFKNVLILVLISLFAACADKDGPDMSLIKEGMSKEEVIKLIGRPDSISQNGSWYYAPHYHSVFFFHDNVFVVVMNYTGNRNYVGPGDAIESSPKKAMKKLELSSTPKVNRSDRLTVIYDHDVIDTLDRILFVNRHEFVLKGSHYSLIINREDSIKYTAILNDHAWRKEGDSYSSHTIDYDVTKADSLQMTISRWPQVGNKIAVNLTFVKVIHGMPNVKERHLLEIFGNAWVPVLSADKFDNKWMPLHKLIPQDY